MVIEVEDVFGTRKATISLKPIMEVNKERCYAQTADGERYGVTSAAIESLLQIMEPRIEVEE